MKRTTTFSALRVGAIGALVLGAAVWSCSDDDSINPLMVDAGGDTIVPPNEASTNETSVVDASGSGITIPKLTAPVTAVTDENGFLHVSGKTDEDVFATVGYFHAANRFFFMDFLRNAVRATLGNFLLAKNVVDHDVTSRAFFSTPTGDPLPEKLVSQADAATKSYLDAYARGVNAWLADVKAIRNGASLTEEYGFIAVNHAQPRDWEPADSMAVALYSLEDLSNNASDETQLGQVAQIIGGLGARPNVAKTLSDLFLDFRPTYDAYTINAAQTPPAMALQPPKQGQGAGASVLSFGSYDPAVQAVLKSASERLSMLPGAMPKRIAGEHGSNNWVISGSRAKNGRPLVANDPHLSLTNPSIWFPIEIDSKSNGGTGHYHVAGGSFPGAPTVQTGHNESIAWGVTVTYWDMSDVYLETLTQGGTAVSFKGADVPLVTKNVSLFDQGKPVTRAISWVPHHGPIVSLDAAHNTAVTIRWRGHDGSTDIQAFFEMDKASSIAEAKLALANITTANQNFVVADKTGKIGYFPYAKVPKRPWAANAIGSSPFFPLPGDGTREWGDPVALTDIPQLEDPAAGFIATANTDMNGATMNGDPLTNPPAGPVATSPIQTVSRAEGTRLQRILDAIVANGGNNTIETMRLLQGDTKSILAQTIVPRFTAAADEAAVDATTQPIVDALKAWQLAGDYTCPSGMAGIDPKGAKSTDATIVRESVGCETFHVALFALADAAFGDELNDPAVALGTVSGNNSVPVLIRALRNDVPAAGETFWQDILTTDHVTTRSEILRRALARAGVVLASTGAANTWRWGTVHTLALSSPLASGGIKDFNSTAYATPGGLFTVNVANPTSNVINSLDLSKAANFSETSGPSIRTLIEVATDGPHMKIQLPGGSDLHRKSKFYNNMIPNWVANTPVDFAFGPGAVKNPASTLTITAATQ